MQLLGKRVVLYGLHDGSPVNGSEGVVTNYDAEEVGVIV